MSKVMLLANDSTYVYNLRREILLKLISEGHTCIIVAKVLKFKEELEAMGCRLIDIDSGRHGKNPLSDLSLLRSYCNLLAQEQPEVVLTYNIKPNIYGGMACVHCNIPYIVNITGLGTAVEYPGLLQKITCFLYKLGVRGASTVFFQNEGNRTFFKTRKLLAAKSAAVLLPGSGVDLERHQAFPYPEAEEPINLLFIARIMKDKGIDLFLDMAELIHSKYSQVRFHICGYCDDDRYKSVLDKYNEGEFLHYYGEQKDLVPFFNMAHCIVHPSYYPEGMSNVLLEAAAHARPIIATNRDGCRETVAPEESGYVVPIKDLAALVAAVESFLELPYAAKKTMGLKGRERVEELFDRKFVVEAYMKAIERILKQ